MTFAEYLKMKPTARWRAVLLLRKEAGEQRKIAWRLFIGNILCIIAVLSFNVRTFITAPTFEFYTKELKELPAGTTLIVATGKMNRVTRYYDYLLIVSGSDPIAVRTTQSLPTVFTVQQHGSTTRIIDLTKQEQQQPPIVGPEI